MFPKEVMYWDWATVWLTSFSLLWWDTPLLLYIWKLWHHVTLYWALHTSVFILHTTNSITVCLNSAVVALKVIWLVVLKVFSELSLFVNACFFVLLFFSVWICVELWTLIHVGVDEECTWFLWVFVVCLCVWLRAHVHFLPAQAWFCTSSMNVCMSVCPHNHEYMWWVCDVVSEPHCSHA